MCRHDRRMGISSGGVGAKKAQHPVPPHLPFRDWTFHRKEMAEPLEIHHYYDHSLVLVLHCSLFLRTTIQPREKVNEREKWLHEWMKEGRKEWGESISPYPTMWLNKDAFSFQRDLIHATRLQQVRNYNLPRLNQWNVCTFICLLLRERERLFVVIIIMMIGPSERWENYTIDQNRAASSHRHAIPLFCREEVWSGRVGWMDGRMINQLHRKHHQDRAGSHVDDCDEEERSFRRMCQTSAHQIGSEGKQGDTHLPLAVSGGGWFNWFCWK